MQGEQNNRIDFFFFGFLFLSLPVSDSTEIDAEIEHWVYFNCTAQHPTTEGGRWINRLVKFNRPFHFILHSPKTPSVFGSDARKSQQKFKGKKKHLGRKCGEGKGFYCEIQEGTKGGVCQTMEKEGRKTPASFTDTHGGVVETWNIHEACFRFSLSCMRCLHYAGLQDYRAPFVGKWRSSKVGEEEDDDIELGWERHEPTER